MPNCALSQLDLVPKLIVDDPKVRHVLDDPFGFRVEPRDALARHRVFDIPQLVPDQFADVELVVEDACFASPIAVDRGWSPRLPWTPVMHSALSPMAMARGERPAANSRKIRRTTAA